MSRAQNIVCLWGVLTFILGIVLLVLSAEHIWDLLVAHWINLLHLLAFSTGVSFVVLGIVWAFVAVNFEDKD